MYKIKIIKIILMVSLFKSHIYSFRNAISLSRCIIFNSFFLNKLICSISLVALQFNLYFNCSSFCISLKVFSGIIVKKLFILMDSLPVNGCYLIQL